VKNERQATALAMRNLKRDLSACAPFAVLLTRFGPRRMDSDNSIAGLKAVRDEVAKQLGVDDGNEKEITFDYAQERGEYAVAIRIDAQEAT
jgi:hypothetical protein